MTEWTLYIGSRAYSSWSLRAGLVASLSGLPVTEVLIPLDQPETRGRIDAITPAGKVPVLHVKDAGAADPLIVWDSLAIAEILAEHAPQAGLWPADPAARAVARAVSAEMHAAFRTLRRLMPMDLKGPRDIYPHGADDAAALAWDIDRIIRLWADTRAAHGAGGPYLFGTPTIADCMYAPVATRFQTYATPLPAAAQEYLAAIDALPGMAAWRAAAIEEPWILENP